MSGGLDELERDVRSARLAIRRAGRHLPALRAARGRELGRYELAAGEQLKPSEIIDFLRLAIGSNKQGVAISVSQPLGAQTKEQDDGEDV